MATKQEIIDFLADEFPQFAYLVDAVGDKSSVLRLKTSHDNLRPGGTISGPSLFGVADGALYVAILAELGIVALAVTTNMNINFLRKPAPDKDIIAECQLIKVGRSLVVGDVFLYSEGDPAPIAHAVGTYSIPPKR